jgi:hypothetical protein
MERELTLDETVALLKDRNAKAREAITALTAQVAELREENKKLRDQLVGPGSATTNSSIQALHADQAETPWQH